MVQPTLQCHCSVGTNVGKEFLKYLIEKNVKVSYSCTQNMEKFIAAKNSKVLKGTLSLRKNVWNMKYFTSLNTI